MFTARKGSRLGPGRLARLFRRLVAESGLGSPVMIVS